MTTKIPMLIKGSLRRLLHNRKHYNLKHKLDTNLDKYYKTLNEVIIPECQEFVKDVPDLPQRLKECISHTTPSFVEGLNFGAELVFRMVAHEHQQTEENLKKMRILRVLLDVNFGMAGILDDLTDKNELRRGKKTWASMCQGGTSASVYDTYTVHYLTTCILKRYFRNDPGYKWILEIFSLVNGGIAIGQLVDIMNRNNFNHDISTWLTLAKYKAMMSVSASGALGLVHAGIINDELVHKTLEIFGYSGLMFQVWDDFMEFYVSKDQSGKGAPDVQLNVISWTTGTAMSHFNEAQANEFKECYGSTDPVKISRVRQLFDEIDLPRKYTEGLKDIRKTVEVKIQDIPDAKIRDACRSCIDWMLEEWCDYELKRLDGCCVYF